MTIYGSDVKTDRDFSGVFSYIDGKTTEKSPMRKDLI
jgi:hypothetical protein